MATVNEATRSAHIVRDAGGRIVGRTRLQKIGFLLEAAGLGEGFTFTYKHYGPYSENLADAARTAGLLGLLQETEQPATWGGVYSTFSTDMPQSSDVSAARRQFAQEGARAGAVELELAATALFLAQEGVQDAWAETARRKPDKAREGRLERAKTLYERLRQVPTPRALPQLV
jgi:uncharacterized protein